MVLHTPADGSAPGYFGVYPAVVTKLVDPDRLGRIQVRFPWLGTPATATCGPGPRSAPPTRTATRACRSCRRRKARWWWRSRRATSAGPTSSAVPGTARQPLPTPATQANDLRTLKTRSGSRLEFDDGTPPKVTVKTPNGHQVTLDDSGTGTITVQISSGASIKVTATSVDISGMTSVSVKAAKVDVTAPIATFSGIVQCEVLQANASVASPVYSPGVCNML